MLFSYIAHRRACTAKQNERQERIRNLASRYREPLGISDNKILSHSVADLVAGVRAGKVDPGDILTAYSKKALKAHAETNCLTEIMISAAAPWTRDCNKQGPLAGVPVSLKDTVGVAGWDSCIGYSALVGIPMEKNSALVRLLLDAGAVPFVKTNIPITLMSFESYSDVFGRTTNPHKSTHSPGGSTGGEAALLAYGGSRIGIGTDVAGSVRIPAHYSGIYTIKASTGRFIKTGSASSMPGQEGVTAVYSPMARTLQDLETFWKAVVSMKPWTYDPTCLVMPWESVDLSEKTVRWGVIWDDGVVSPSPACARALQTVVDTLEKHGHEVMTIHPPSPYEGLKIASQLLMADAMKTATKPMRTLERNDIGMRQAMRMFALPHWIRRVYVWFNRYILRDEIYAGLIEGWYEKRITEYWPLIVQREDYRRRWFEMWNEESLDFVLTVPNALPAVPHGGAKEGFKNCGYTLLFNLLDYSAGVLPITHVDKVLDQLGAGEVKPRNAIEKGSYKMYDPAAMHGLPVGVQIVGRRLEEEKVMEGMKTIERLLNQDGIGYQLLETS